MGMMYAAFDAAGQEVRQPCLAVAGFISSATDWEDFDTQWRSRLGKDGLSYFRMSEFAQWTGAFSEKQEWPEERRRALLGDLVAITQKHVYHKFGCAVVNATFEDMDEEVRKAFGLTAYVLAARTCAGDVRGWSSDAYMPRAPIAYIFEAGDTGKDGPLKGKLIERLEHDAFPTPIFWPKKDIIRDGVTHPGFAGLQAADILAYEHSLVAKRGEASRWAFWEFDKYPPGVLTQYTVSDLKELERRLGEVGGNPDVQAL